MASITDFRNVLKDETSFLHLNIDKYNKILEEDLEQLPESVVGQIRLVIGQSKLFINERFKQFSGLIDDCEYKRCEKEIKIEDLAGFWDMINYQIDDLKTKYEELEKLKSNKWQPTVNTKAIDNDENQRRQSSKLRTITNRKPLQVTNGYNQNNNNKSSINNNTTVNGKTSNGHHTNNNDCIDSSKKCNSNGNHHINSSKSTTVTSSANTNNKATSNKAVKSNFREFLRNKVKQQEQKQIENKSQNNVETTFININNDLNGNGVSNKATKTKTVINDANDIKGTINNLTAKKTTSTDTTKDTVTIVTKENGHHHNRNNGDADNDDIIAKISNNNNNNVDDIDQQQQQEK